MLGKQSRLLFTIILSWMLGVLPLHAQTITVNPSQTLQTMRGWELVSYAAQELPTFDTFKDALFDGAVAIGIDRVRLEVRAGSENTIETMGSRQRYQTVNDNASPNVINPAGFHWTELDQQIERVVLPMRQRLAAKGESLWVNLCYVSFRGSATTGSYVHSDPAEYAEFMLALFQHTESTYGFVPNSIEVILEPDHDASTYWNAGGAGTKIANAIIATAQRLATAGYTPQFVGPSTYFVQNAVTYTDQMLAVSGVTDYLKELSYHRYALDAPAYLPGLLTRARAHNLSLSMLEWWKPENTYNTLHDDLENGRNSAWQQGAFIGDATNAPSGLYYLEKSALRKSPLTRYAQIYYRDVRRCAVRLEASSLDANFDPLAFRNPNDTHTLIVKAARGGTFTVAGLPAGTYRPRYTTEDAEAVEQPDIILSPGGTLSASIPAAGVIALASTVSGNGDSKPQPCGEAPPVDSGSPERRPPDGVQPPTAKPPPSTRRPPG